MNLQSPPARKRGDWRNWVAAVVLPFLVDIVLVLAGKIFRIDGLFGLSDPDYQVLSFVAITTGTGFIFVIREFRWYSPLVGIVYFPVFGILVVLFAFGFNAFVFGGP